MVRTRATLGSCPTCFSPEFGPGRIQCYVITSNIVGNADVGAVTYYGHARIIDPLGQVIADTGESEGMVVADIDLKSGILTPEPAPSLDTTS